MILDIELDKISDHVSTKRSPWVENHKKEPNQVVLILPRKDAKHLLSILQKSLQDYPVYPIKNFVQKRINLGKLSSPPFLVPIMLSDDIDNK